MRLTLKSKEKTIKRKGIAYIKCSEIADTRFFFFSFLLYLSAMSYYRYHVFFCVNQREDGSACCANHDSQAMRDYVKEKVKSLGLNADARVRVNTAGCLDRCAEGPVIVVYPEGTWYTYVDKDDVDEIIDQHLVHGRIVERLKI